MFACTMISLPTLIHCCCCCCYYYLDLKLNLLFIYERRTTSTFFQILHMKYVRIFEKYANYVYILHIN